MAIKYKRNCKTCQISRDYPDMRKRIYYAAFKREDGDETLADLAQAMVISPSQVYNHAKKHISKSEPLTQVKVEARVARVKGSIAKELELSFEHEDIVPKENYERVIDLVLEEGEAQLKNRGKNITVSQIIAAAKVKSDYMTKKRGQDVELIKTMYRSINGTPQEPGRLVTESADGPGSLHREAAGPAAA